MHSSQFTQAARAADEIGRVIVTMAECPHADGCHHSAWLICINPDADTYDRSFSVHRVIFGRDGAFLDSSSYDIDRERAWLVWADHVAFYVRRDPDPVRA